MKIPGWLLKVMVNYLTNRKLKVKFKGKVSDEKHIKAGTGQGCYFRQVTFEISKSCKQCQTSCYKSCKNCKSLKKLQKAASSCVKLLKAVKRL